MNWIRIAVGITRDPSIIALSEAVGVSVPTTTGHVVGVLTSLPEGSDTGALGDISDTTLEQWAMWRGKRGVFASAFRAQLCDSHGVVRSWDKYNGAEIRRAKAAAARAKAWRTERKENAVANAHRTRTERVANAHRTALRNETIRDVLPATDLQATNSGGAVSAPPVPEAPAARKPKPPKPVKWPDWPQGVRQRMHERWRSKLGDVPFPQWVSALGPMFGAPPSPWSFPQMAGAYDSWLSSVAAGGASSPFLRRNPGACAGVLAAIAAINDTMHADDPERLAAIDRVIHGRVAA